jgi:hypothetical protein
MAVRLECRDPRPVGLQIKVLCGTSAERNNLATKSEHSRSVVRVRRTNPWPNGGRKAYAPGTGAQPYPAASRVQSIMLRQKGRCDEPAPL